MKENNYITIPGFLRTRLNLKGNELLITALIYGFSQDGKSWFHGKTEYIAEWVGVSEKHVLRILKNLTDKGVLEKKEIYVNNQAKRCYYRFCDKYVAGCENVTVAGCENVTHDNIYNDNIDNNIKKEKYKKEKKGSPENKFSVIINESENINFEESEQNDITQTLRGTAEPKRCLFANSRFAKFEDFEKCFDKPEFKEIDILYYYNSVADWSASKGRMQKDWIAQARNFMRGDKNKGQLHLKPQYDTSHINIADALDYLNENF